MRLSTLVILAAAVAVGCADPAPSPTEPDAGALAPRFGKPVRGPTDPTADFLLPTSGFGIVGDGLPAYLAQDGTSGYRNGECGVQAKVFATAGASDSGDATLNTHNPRFSDRKCSDYPRELVFDYGDGSTDSTPAFVNVATIHRVADENGIAVDLPIVPSTPDDDATWAQQASSGLAVERSLHFMLDHGHCGSVLFGKRTANGDPNGEIYTFLEGTDGAGTGNLVWVRRISADTYQVRTRPYPDDQGFCNTTGELFHMPVRMTIVEK